MPFFFFFLKRKKGHYCLLYEGGFGGREGMEGWKVWLRESEGE